MALVEGMGEALLNSNLVDGKAQNCLQSDPEALTKSNETIANGIACLTGEAIWGGKPIQKGGAWPLISEVGQRKGTAPIEMQNGGSGPAGSKIAANWRLESEEGASESEEKGVVGRECRPKKGVGESNGSVMVNGFCEGKNPAPLPTSQEESDGIIESVIQCLDEKFDKNTLTDQALELLSLVPEGYIPLPHQIGGHRHVDGKLGFLRRIGQPKILFKPVQPGIKGPREVTFYQSLFRDEATDLPPDIQQLRELIPRYQGIEIIQDRAGEMHEYMKLEDITHRFRRPCIMDVKLGRRVWDDFAEQDKIDREKKKYPAQEIIGFRIIGMRVFNTKENGYHFYDRMFGRNLLTVDSAMQAVSKFFHNGSEQRTDVLHLMLDRLNVYLQWFENQTAFKLFATSLLLVYEGDCSQPISPNELLAIRLVDFAHAIPGDAKPDENILFGLRKFIEFLQILT